MSIYSPDELKRLMPRAHRILRAGHLWKLTDRRSGGKSASGDFDSPEGSSASPGKSPPGEAGPGEAAAWVLDDQPEPHRVIWHGDYGSCDCGCGGLCVHITALMLRLSISELNEPRESLSKSTHPESPGADDQGDTGQRQPNYTQLENLHPEHHLLFFVEPEAVTRRRIHILGRGEDMETTLRAPLGRSPRTAVSGELIFSDLKKNQWRLTPGELSIRDDGSPGRVRPAHAPVTPKSTESPPVPPPISAAEAGNAILALIGNNEEIMSPDSRAWSVRFAAEIVLRFEPLLGEAHGDPLYEPIVALSDGPSPPAEYTGALIPGENTLLALDHAKSIIAVAEESGGAVSFLRLILSRPALSGSDLRARFSSKSSIPEGIRVILPDIPEALPVLQPALVLEITDRGDTVDLRPFFRYPSTPASGTPPNQRVPQAPLISPSAESAIITETLPATLPHRRPRPVGRRNTREEERLITRAETILGGALSWKRGRYAALTGHADIPLRVETNLITVLTTFGPSLMEAGIIIQLENRPLRFAGTLRLNAKHEGLSLQITAAVESSSSQLDQLDLDPWLDRGLARTENAYFLLTEKALDQLTFLQRRGMDTRGFLSTSPGNISLIDAVYSQLEADGPTAAELAEKRAAYRSLAEFTPGDEPPPPASFRGALRPYQRQGYAWLLRLHELGLGGTLADDMGLGKTVQTLAYLCRLKADGRLGFSLLAAPVVTLANWSAEIRRFAPEITVHQYRGPSDKRFIPDEDYGIDLLVVSYQTLRNDAERFLDREWDHIILDEAHYVKNASSRTYKTVQSLRARHRVSLTGTPLENHLGELWSQMSFLNPGLLGSRADFDRLYARPVQRDGDEAALERLGAVIAPFLLRRRKADVLEDLPPKDESVIRCEMSPEQAEAYRALSELYYRQVTGLLSDEGLDGARIQIFTILSKLRLLAIHPPLAGEQFAGLSSGKMDALDSLLDEILEEDHKVLVFSQFLGALDRAERTCRRRGWKFSRLTGSTTDRETPIARFRDNPDLRVFLLSLRAGGVGINLTAADYVVLLDPWWNPAVEAQAVDRAHRMGQTRPVMAYRLITAETIEEKVLELQEKKKGLAAGALGEGGIPDLDEEDILALFGGGSK